MIKLLDDYTMGFINFLNNKHFTDEEVKISIIQNYDVVSANNDDECGFGVYIERGEDGESHIMIPTGCELATTYHDFLASNIAHEYRHFLQDVNDMFFPTLEDYEEDANKFAEEMIKEYENEQNNN